VLRLIQGARIIGELDSQVVPEDAWGTWKRTSDRIRSALEKLSFEYGLACRVTALVAVVVREGDTPGRVPKTVIVPVGMPQDVSWRSYFAPASARPDVPEMVTFEPVEMSAATLITNSLGVQKDVSALSAEEILTVLARLIGFDGGMLGRTAQERVAATVGALFLFAAEGHTSQHGAFASHVRRMLYFLESADLSGLDQNQQDLVAEALARLKAGEPPRTDWLSLARSCLRDWAIPAGRLWEKIETEVR